MAENFLAVKTIDLQRRRYRIGCEVGIYNSEVQLKAVYGVFYAVVETHYAVKSTRQQLESPALGVAHNRNHTFARRGWRVFVPFVGGSLILCRFGMAVVIGRRLVGYGDIALVRGVDAVHKCLVQRAVVRVVGQVVQIDEQVYHLVYDRIFGLTEREIVRSAETEIEIIVRVSPLTVYIAVTRGALAYEGTCRTQSKRDLWQASAENQ